MKKLRTMSIGVSGLAALCLATLHIVDLRIPDFIYNSPDPVFPFVNGILVYATFSAILAFYGFLCLAVLRINLSLYRSALIGCIVLVAYIILYRISLRLLDIPECNCLGRLANLLKVTKANQPLLRFSVLAVLGLPIIVSAANLLWGRIYNRRAATRLALYPLLLVWCCAGATADDILTISGFFKSRSQNPATGVEYTNQSSSGRFTAQISGKNFRYTLSDEADNSVFESISDGTFTCYVETDAQRTWIDPNIEPGQTIATVNAGQWPMVPLGRIPSYFVWFMFCATETSVSKRSEDERPLPWEEPRFHLNAYGYRWTVASIPGTRFLQTAEAVRDTQLDFDQVEREFLRKGFAYPYNAEGRYRSYEQLNRRKYVPSDLLAGSYHCTSTNTFGGRIVPTRGHLVTFLHDWIVRNGTNYPFPLQIIDANVDKVSQMEAPFDFALYSPKGGPIAVFDHRFQTIKSNRYCDHVYYKLASGQRLRSLDNAESLSQQKSALSHGPVIRPNGNSAIHKYLWTAFLIIGLGGLALARSSQSEQTTGIK